MREKHIDERLQAICDLVPEGTGTLLDVGTDHGYVPIHLIKNNIVKHAIASDISPPSLKKAQREIEKSGLSNRIETRVGSGLEVIHRGDEIDVVVVSGMGGVLISQLLETSKELISRSGFTFIFQPVQAPQELRSYLARNDFVILDEVFLKSSNKYYQIIVAMYKATPSFVERFPEFEDVKEYYELSPGIIRKSDAVLLEYVEGRLEEISYICLQLETLKKKKRLTSVQEDRLNLMVRKKEFYEKVRKYALKRIG